MNAEYHNYRMVVEKRENGLFDVYPYGYYVNRRTFYTIEQCKLYTQMMGFKELISESDYNFEKLYP